MEIREIRGWILSKRGNPGSEPGPRQHACGAARSVALVNRLWRGSKEGWYLSNPIAKGTRDDGIPNTIVTGMKCLGKEPAPPDRLFQEPPEANL